MDIEGWLDEKMAGYERLTENIVSVTKSILSAEGVKFLSVTGRTKERKSIIEKIKRKKYNKIDAQLTDVTGVRIVVFIETDIARVCEALRTSFQIDEANSNYDMKSPRPDHVGYRSAHMVASIGAERSGLREFVGLEGLVFEFQIRTILQHAWAELAHDRAYKFESGLPYEITRKLNLHAGLLEIADRGFAELVAEIESYKKEIGDQYNAGNQNIEVNTLTLKEFIDRWASKTGFEVFDTNYDDYQSLIDELYSFGVHSIGDLEQIIPDGYAEVAQKHQYSTTIFGIVRDWMGMTDPAKVVAMQPGWRFFDDEFDVTNNNVSFYQEMISDEDASLLRRLTGY